MRRKCYANNHIARFETYELSTIFFQFLEDKPHKCQICARAFRKHSALVIHHRVHSGEKPYRCPECSKNFSISGNLRRHFLIHTGERPYVCPECSRAFNNPSHLTRHRRKLHTIVRTESAGK